MNHARKTGYPYGTDLTKKINQTIKYLNIRPETMKLLEKYIQQKLSQISFG